MKIIRCVWNLKISKAIKGKCIVHHDRIDCALDFIQNVHKFSIRYFDNSIFIGSCLFCCHLRLHFHFHLHFHLHLNLNLNFCLRLDMLNIHILKSIRRPTIISSKSMDTKAMPATRWTIHGTVQITAHSLHIIATMIAARWTAPACSRYKQYIHIHKSIRKWNSENNFKWNWMKWNVTQKKNVHFLKCITKCKRLTRNNHLKMCYYFIGFVG